MSQLNGNGHQNTNGYKAEDITLHHQEVNELIGDVPVWTMRWGLALVVFALGSLLFFSIYIRYPVKEMIEMKCAAIQQDASSQRYTAVLQSGGTLPATTQKGMMLRWQVYGQTSPAVIEGSIKAVYPPVAGNAWRIVVETGADARMLDKCLAGTGIAEIITGEHRLWNKIVGVFRLH
jgi:hypothetical protein